MSRVGVRELRQRASELLRRVEAGESIEITDRGRPVAVLGPLPQAGELARLVATGDASSATGDLEELLAELEDDDFAWPEAILGTASDRLARLREDER